MDYIENGICGGLPIPNPFQTTNFAPCTLIQDDMGNVIGIDSGVCSNLTETLLMNRDECGLYLRQQPNIIFNTLLSSPGPKPQN